MDVKEFGHSIKITVAFYMFSLVVVAVAAWYISDVHTRFQIQNEKMQGNRDRTEYINKRIDTKHDRQALSIEKLEERIKDLERPNTDK